MLKKILFILLISITAIAQEAPDSEVGGDTNLSKIEIPLNQGIWNPDGIATGERVDFSDITNFRPTDNGIKAVDGYQRINTTAVPSYPYIKSLYQYTSDGVTDYSMLLAQADDGAGNSVVIQNNSTVPYSGTDAPFVSYAELITNGGFETTGGWSNYSTPATAEISTDDYHTGTHSFKLVTNSTHGIQTASNSYFAISKDVVYTLKLWIKASGPFSILVTESTNTNNASYWPNTIGKIFQYTGAEIHFIQNEWSYIEVSFISYNNISSAKLAIRGYSSGGTYFIDDVSLKAEYLLDSNVSNKGQFAKGPKDSVLYSNSYENYIWNGMESEPAVVFTATNDVDDYMVNPRDWTTEAINEDSSSDDVVYVGFSDQTNWVTELLLHADSDFDDESTNNFTVTDAGDTVITNSIYKYGGGSIALDGTGDYLSIPDDSAWNLGTWEIDYWIYLTDLTTDFYIFNQDDGTNYSRLYYDIETHTFIYEKYNGVGTTAKAVSDEYVLPKNSWFHFYGSTMGNSARIMNFFITGEDVGCTNITVYAYANIAAAFEIGEGIKGYIDELHVSAGVGIADSWGAYWGTYGAYTDFQVNEVPYDITNAQKYLLIGSHSPVQAVKIYTPGYTDGQDWFSESINISAQEGWISCNSYIDGSYMFTHDEGWIVLPKAYLTYANKKTINGLTLYWIKIKATSRIKQISSIRLFSPFQEMQNSWDQEYLPSAEAKVWKNAANTFYDYSDQVNSEVTTDVMDLSGLTSSDYVKVSFAQRVSGIKIYMPDDNINTTAATTLSLYGWSGSAWQKVKNASDGTSSNSVSLAKTGVVTFEGFPKPQEHMYADDYGQLFYQYKLVWDKTLSTSVKPYYIEGIPYVEDPPSSKFPLSFNNRAVLANLSDGPADILISATNAPFIYNGKDSARYRIGGEGELVSGVSMTVKYESGNYDLMLLHKKNETWQVQGTTPDTFTIHRLSDKTGCIAPSTIDTMQISDGNHIAMWLSSSGVVMSDGTNITRVQGIDQHFDKTKPNLLINYTYAYKAIGFFDYDNLEYNLQMPYGSSTSNNLWLVYSLKKQKWFKKNAPQYFESAAGVRDSYGGRYVYGGMSDGYLVRNEYSSSWFGTEATCKSCTVKSSVVLNELELGSMWNEGTIKHMRLRGKNLPKKMNFDDDIATAYTEVDASSKLTKTQATDLSFAFTDAGGSAKAYAYTNTGSTFLNANWEEWAYTTEINLSSVTTSDGAYVFGLCEANTDDFETVVDVSNKAGYGVKVVGTAAGVYRLEFEHWTGGAESQTGTNTITGLTQGTTYFVTIVKTKDYGYNDSPKKQYRLLGYVHTDKELRNEIGSVSTYINASNDVDTDLPYLYYFSAASVASIGTVKNTAEIDYLAAFIRKDGMYNWSDIKFFGSAYDSETDYLVPKYEDIVRRIESRKANTSQIQLTVNRKWTDGKPPELYKVGILYDLERVDSIITTEY